MSSLAPLPIGAATRVIFFGTPHVAVAPLHALHDAAIRIDLVITRPDIRRGRGTVLSPSPVKLVATELGIPVSHDLADAASLANNDELLGVVVAYGRLLPMSLLSVVPMVNVHFSLLPRWRGAAPVERALLAGDLTTGVCVMRVVKELDMGEIYRREEIDIDAAENADTLRYRLCAHSIPLLLDVVLRGAGTGVPQTGQATYAAKITRSDLNFDWSATAEQLARITRIGVGHTAFHGKRLNIQTAKVVDLPGSSVRGQFIGLAEDGIVVATGQGAICLQSVQPEGKPVLDALSWSRGARLKPGELFG